VNGADDSPSLHSGNRLAAFVGGSAIPAGINQVDLGALRFEALQEQVGVQGGRSR
jgi:hypothetical protein